MMEKVIGSIVYKEVLSSGQTRFLIIFYEDGKLYDATGILPITDIIIDSGKKLTNK